MKANTEQSNNGPYGPTSLLILQAVENCNLNCTYCYLPNRAKSGKMSLETVSAAIKWLRDEELLGDTMEIVWHAGEPLLAGLDFYRSAHDIVSRNLSSATKWKFVFQTNGTLINDDWASFFAHVKAQVGISIDGPREWHDARRRTWGGKGSFDKVMRGVDCLKRHGIPFSTVSVLSEHALHNPTRLYDFLRDIGSESFGFNDEEQEGANTTSLQYSSESACEDAEYFYSVLYDLATRDACYGKIREISQSLEAMHCQSKAKSTWHSLPQIASELNDPFGILNVAFDGSFSTFSPELLGHAVKDIGVFTFGNVHSDSLDDVLKSEKFRLAHSLIEAGIDQCRSTCEYYELCGGGSPSNKYFENGRFDSAATMFCRLSIIAPINAVLAKLETEEESMSSEYSGRSRQS